MPDLPARGQVNLLALLAGLIGLIITGSPETASQFSFGVLFATAVWQWTGRITHA